MNTEDILSSMDGVDMGCCFIDTQGRKNSNVIILDNDPDGNGRWGYLFFKVKKNCITLTSGSQLKKGEKKSWSFKDYSNVDGLVDDIGDFTRKYFRSFTTIRK